jgi:hypothetical protein
VPRDATASTSERRPGSPSASKTRFRACFTTKLVDPGAGRPGGAAQSSS